MDREQGVPRIIGALQHVLQLERLETGGDLLRLRLERALEREIDVGFGLEQLVQLAPLVHALPQRVIGLEPTLQRLDLGDGLPRPVGVGPEGAPRHDSLQLGQPGRLSIDVKGSP